MSADEPTVPPNPRRTRTIALVAVIAAAAVLATLFALTRDDAEPGAASPAVTEGDATADPSGETGQSAPTSAPTTTELPAALLVPVSGSDEGELCAAVVERLTEYRDLAASGGVDQQLVEALDEFEAQVDTQSDDQDWGDRIVEQLTNVRREWVTALAAEESGDPGTHLEAAAAFLDTAIDDAGCPTD